MRVLHRLVLLLFAAAQVARAEDKPIVAVFPLEDTTGKFTAKVPQLTAYFQVKITEGGRFVLVPRADVEKAIQEAKAESYKACYDQSCQIDVGRELAAQKVLHTQVVEVGGQCALTSTLYDLRLAATDKAASKKLPCNESDLVAALEEVAAILSGGEAVPKDRPVGGLFIKSSPEGATVRLDGRELETKTPVTLDRVAAGEHQLEVVLGTLGKSMRVQIPARDFLRLDLRLEALNASVRVISDPPEAAVEIDGRSVGKTPLVVQSVFYGEHRVRITKEGFVDDEGTIAVSGDAEVARRLAPAAILIIETVPAGARIRVGAREIGLSPAKVYAASGKVEVSAELDGYVLAKQSVDGTAGRTTPLRLELAETADRAGERARFEVSLASYKTARDEFESDHSKGLGWLGMVGGIASAGGAAALFAVSASKQSDYHAATLASDIDTAHSSSATLETGGDLLAILAIGGISYAIYEWATAPEQPTAPVAPGWYRGEAR